MAALFPRCVSDFSCRIEIYLTRLKRSFCYYWESEAIRLPTLGLDFPGMDFNERPRICLVSTKTCMESEGVVGALIRSAVRSQTKVMGKFTSVLSQSEASIP